MVNNHLKFGGFLSSAFPRQYSRLYGRIVNQKQKDSCNQTLNPGPIRFSRMASLPFRRSSPEKKVNFLNGEDRARGEAGWMDPLQLGDWWIVKRL